MNGFHSKLEETAILTREEIQAWRPSVDLPDEGEYAKPLITRLMETGIWHDRQLAGRRWAMGCVALEITQRCNLDCTLCYLSPYSEAVKDIPLGEIFKRIETIFRQYGPNTMSSGL